MSPMNDAAPGSESARPVEAPDQPTHAEDGVDLTLIRWSLGLSPTERLEWLHRQMTALAELQRAAGVR